MAKRRESAEAVFAALFKAQEAASAAARASGTAPTLFRSVSDVTFDLPHGHCCCTALFCACLSCDGSKSPALL